MNGENLSESPTIADMVMMMTDYEGEPCFTNDRLYAAAESGNLREVEFLVTHGATDLEAALRIASHYGELPVVKYLIEHGVSPNEGLLNAIKQPRVFRYLLKLVKNQDTLNMALIFLIRAKSPLSLVKEVIKYGADVHHDDNLALECAFEEGDKAVFEYLGGCY